MEQNSLDSDDTSNEQIDDNLLEPLSEVLFSEREQRFKTASNNDKDSDASLPDARAKELRLRRIQRGGDSSNDTVKSDASKKRSKSGSGDNEKEETVSFSLESIIRRGLNEQKLSTNFNSNFKFGKPDDNISLRVNPSANLCYENSNTPYSDSTSDTYESSGEKETNDRSEFNMDGNGSAVENGNDDDIDEHLSIKRKRGRPKLSDEEKLERAAQKQAIRLQNQSESKLNSYLTHANDLLTMGHSIFSDCAPKKRGRPPKQKTNENLSNSNATQNDDSLVLNDSSNATKEIPTAKKRGRKPKSYYLELAARLNQTAPTENSNDQDDNTTATTESHLSATLPAPGPKKRGRKPKYLEKYYVKLEQTAYENATNQNENTSNNVSVEQPAKKKRGRKPKSYYQQHELNTSAPAILQEQNLNGSIQQSPYNGSMKWKGSLDLSSFAKKRGRRPKAYYEQLTALEKQQQSAQTSNKFNHSNAANSTQGTINDSILSNEPPAKKKRGRKPKSYYLELQQREQQQLQQQQLLPNQSTPLVTVMTSTSQNSNMFTDNQQANGNIAISPVTSNFLPAKRIPKPSLKQLFTNRKPYVKQGHQNIFRRPVIFRCFHISFPNF